MSGRWLLRIDERWLWIIGLWMVLNLIVYTYFVIRRKSRGDGKYISR